MYTTTTSSTFNESEDSKYTVADILSSMASGEPMTSNYTTAAPFVSSGTSLVSTPLLTPTTLASLEQTFIELQSVPPTTTAQDLSRQSGFVPPIVDPVTNDFPVFNGEEARQDPDWLPSEAKRARGNHGGVIVNAATATPGVITTPAHRRGGRKIKNDECMDPEEEKRRSMRRERNKLAAARCRQRRVDLTNKLIVETDDLEEEQAELQNEIQTLQQQKEQLEFLLQAHKPVCPVKRLGGIHVKAEPMDTQDRSSNNSPADLRINVKMDHDNVPKVSQSGLSRPTSLALPSSTSVTEATGVSINTPSTGLTLNTPSVLLGLESMIDGHTGLTPLVSGPSCASQVHRASTESSSGNENLSSPTLCAL